MHDGHGGHQHPTTLTESAPVVPISSARADTDLLTPADVRKKVFATVRLREGYDLAQVDTFLDQVENTLSSVLRENAALKTRLNGSRQAPSQAGESATHIVALAQDAANQAIAMAQEDARAIVADARDQAEATRREALGYASRLREGLEQQMRQLRDLLTELQEQSGPDR